MNDFADVRPGPAWTGLDRDFHARAVAAARSDEGAAVRDALQARFMYGPDKPFLLGPPLLVLEDFHDAFKRLTRSYHAAIESIVEAYGTDEAVREVLAPEAALLSDIDADTDPRTGRLHICRLDLLVEADGGYRVLETNANCPGGFLFSGPVNLEWRTFLEGQGLALPPGLRHEEENFMARWFLEVAEDETGERPDFVALLREEGGNRFELDSFLEELHAVGVDAVEADPRELTVNGRGKLQLRGRPLSHAYLKLGMQPFLRMRPELETLVNAVREQRLWVQNGQRGRWVGDNKLCLAVLSDPRFQDLFDPADWGFLQEHIPWSRNLALLDPEQLQAVRSRPDDYVLKRPLDTRGQGVVVGRGTTPEEWAQAVKVAQDEAWLVQGFHDTSWVERDFEGTAFNRHDIALGAINGELTTIFARSSAELRVNMARTGRMHPVYLGR